LLKAFLKEKSNGKLLLPLKMGGKRVLILEKKRTWLWIELFTICTSHIKCYV